MLLCGRANRECTCPLSHQCAFEQPPRCERCNAVLDDDSLSDYCDKCVEVRGESDEKP